MKNWILGIYWRLFIVRLSLRWIRQLNIGDAVIYQGQRWTLSNGVADPVWSLMRCEPDEEHAYIRVHRKHFRKVPGIHSAWLSFAAGYRFYRGYWLDIWVREGIQPWMRGCRIWAGEPPR